MGTFAVGLLVLAACGAGETLAAKDVADVSATLTGKVHNSVTGPTEYWFEYGTTDQYGTSTPTETIEVVAASGGEPVEVDIDGLEPETTYHYRLCAQDDEGSFCGHDRTFTTTAPRSSVVGSGLLGRMFPLTWSSSVNASSAPDGSDIDGFASVSPGTIFRFSDSGPVTCVSVSGNRATVGFLTDYSSDFPDPDDWPPDAFSYLVYVEDNGPTGDRMSYDGVPEPPTTCPTATDADFVPNSFGMGPELEDGDYTVVDASTPG